MSSFIVPAGSDITLANGFSHCFCSAVMTAHIFRFIIVLPRHHLIRTLHAAMREFAGTCSGLWAGSFKEGLRAENTRLAQYGTSPYHLKNPYYVYVLGAPVFLAPTFVFAGWKGLLVYLRFTILAQMQLLLIDYVQHYDLSRRLFDDGKYEPVSIHHSWNSPHVFTSALMLNAPRHSDHQAHPSIKYSELKTRASEGTPGLPRSITVVSCITLFLGLWKRVMKPLVEDWHHQHTESGTEIVRKIARFLVQFS